MRCIPCAIALLLAATSGAQDCPNARREIHIIPWGAGGATDTIEDLVDDGVLNGGFLGT